MVEIFVLINLCKRVGRIAREKGHRAGGYQFLMVMLWFGAEFLGGFVAGAVLYFLSGEVGDEAMLVIWPVGIAGAALGAWGGFQIVKGLPDRRQEEAYFEGANIERE